MGTNGRMHGRTHQYISSIFRDKLSLQGSLYLLNWTKPFDSGLKKWMRKVARHSDGVDSLNPCCWRGKRLHHHDGGVCWLFVLLWMDSWHHKLIVCKKWYKNNRKMRLTHYFLIHVGVHHTNGFQHFICYGTNRGSCAPIMCDSR